MLSFFEVTQQHVYWCILAICFWIVLIIFKSFIKFFHGFLKFTLSPQHSSIIEVSYRGLRVSLNCFIVIRLAFFIFSLLKQDIAIPRVKLRNQRILLHALLKKNFSLFVKFFFCQFEATRLELLYFLNFLISVSSIIQHNDKEECEDSARKQFHWYWEAIRIEIITCQNRSIINKNSSLHMESCLYYSTY